MTTAAAASSGKTGKTPIDIETLVQWAVQQSGHLPWRGVDDRELMYDYGYTALQRQAPPRRSSGRQLARAVGQDAAAVIAAVQALDGGVAAVVIACARAGIRPDWMPGVAPRLVPKPVYERIRRRGKKRHRRSVRIVWEPCDPQAICAARAVYRRWHAALRGLIAPLAGNLSDWNITGLAAPAEPWERDAEKAA
jgi:hypothetical protein